LIWGKIPLACHGGVGGCKTGESFLEQATIRHALHSDRVPAGVPLPGLKLFL